jgi:hypothetical protein
MNTKRSHQRQRTFSLLLGIFAFVCASTSGVHAATATSTWTGAGSIWNIAGNWTGGVPTDTERALFAGAVGSTTPTLSDVTDTIHSISFAGDSNYTLSADPTNKQLIIGDRTAGVARITKINGGGTHQLHAIGESSLALERGGFEIRGGGVANVGISIQGGDLNITDTITFFNVPMTVTGNVTAQGEINISGNFTGEAGSSITTNAFSAPVRGRVSTFSQPGETTSIRDTTIHNTGGYTEISGQTTTFSGTTINNLPDGAGIPGYTVCSANHTILHDNSVINNLQVGGVRGHLILDNFGRIVDGGGTGAINNTGGYTQIVEDASLNNLQISNTLDGGHQGYLQILGGKTLSLSALSSILNIGTAGLSILMDEDSSIIGGTIINSGLFDIERNVSFDGTHITNIPHTDNTGGLLGILADKTLTTANAFKIINRANANGARGQTNLANESTITEGAIDNEGGHTHIQGNVTLTSTSISSIADGNDIRGSLTVSDGVSITMGVGEGAVISNLSNAAGVTGYTEFRGNNTFTNGNIINVGGFTLIDAGVNTFNNVDVLNIDGEFSPSFLTISPNTTLDMTGGGSVFPGGIYNEASSTTSRSYTELTAGSTLANAAVYNAGGYTLSRGTASFSNITLKNFHSTGGFFGTDNPNKRGFLAVDGTGGSPTFTGGEVSFDILSKPAGFAMLYNGATLTLPNNTVTLYVDTSTTYTNAVRTLIYGETGIGNSALTAPTTIVVKDIVTQDVLPNATVTLDTATREVTNSGNLGVTEATVYNGALHSLLRVTLTTSSLDEESLRTIRTAHTAATGRTLSAVQSIAKAVTNRRRSTFHNKKSDVSVVILGRLDASSFKAPSLDGSSFLNATEGMMNAVSKETASLLDPLRLNKTSIWFQPFGQYVDEGDSSSSDGYTSKTAGFVFGMDYEVSPNTLVGASIGTAQSTSKTSGGSKSLIKDKFITLFGMWSKGPWFVESLLSFSYNRFRLGRQVNDTTLANSTHNGYQIMPSLGMGYRRTLSNVLSLTSHINVSALYGSEKGYTEENAGGANLSIKDQINSQVRSKIGSDLTYLRTHDFGKATYDIGVSMIMENPLRKGAIKGSLGSGSTFSVNLNDSSTLKGGLNLSSNWAIGELWGAHFNYAGEYGTRYHAHEVALKVRSKL